MRLRFPGVARSRSGTGTPGGPTGGRSRLAGPRVGAAGAARRRKDGAAGRPDDARERYAGSADAGHRVGVTAAVRRTATAPAPGDAAPGPGPRAAGGRAARSVRGNRYPG